MKRSCLWQEASGETHAGKLNVSAAINYKKQIYMKTKDFSVTVLGLCFNYSHETALCQTISFLLGLTKKTFVLLLVFSNLVPISSFLLRCRSMQNCA